MKIIRTTDLTILKTWLIGGQVNAMGNCCEGFNDFCDDECIAYLRDRNGNLDIDLIKDSIVSLICQFGDDGFDYYNDKYKFKIPGDKNLNILAKRIKNEVENDD